MGSENAPEFLKRLVGVLSVLWRRVAWNILRRVRRRQIKLSIQKQGIEIFGVLEIGNRFVDLSIFKSLHSMI